MKVVVETPFAYFSDYKSKDIDLIRSKLTWEVGYGKEKEEKTLLFCNRDTKQYYTYFGLIEPLSRLKKLDIEIVESDCYEDLKRYDVRDDLLEGITLYPFQTAAVEKCLMLKKGIVKAVTSSGKTEIMIPSYLI